MNLVFIALNTHRPLFSEVRLRQAVSYAIDRRALARVGVSFVPEPYDPIDHYLPPGLPGFRDAHVYPLTSDLAKAGSLIERKRRTAVLYTCNFAPCDRQAQIIKDDLGAIGIQVRVKTFPLQALWPRVATPGAPFDLAALGWNADYPDPSAMLDSR